MSAHRCDNCVHCVTATAPDKTLIRECRRNPPIGQFISTPQGAGPVTFFPIVKPDWHCGAFQPLLSMAN